MKGVLGCRGVFAGWLLLGGLGFVASAAAATLEGRVFLQPAPDPGVETFMQQRPHYGHLKPVPHFLEVGPGGGVGNAVVLVEGIRGTDGKVSPRVVLTQRDMTFVPHVMVVPVGTLLWIDNEDPVLHNVHAYQNGRNLFNYATPHRGRPIPFRLRRPGLVQIMCDVGHTWMSAFIHVTDALLYAVTDTRGRFRIRGIPAGTYRLRIWHEVLGERVQEVTVSRGDRTRVEIPLSRPVGLASVR